MNTKFLYIFLFLSISFSFSCSFSEEEEFYLFHADLLSDTSLAKYAEYSVFCRPCWGLERSDLLKEWVDKYPEISQAEWEILLFEKLNVAFINEIINKKCQDNSRICLWLMQDSNSELVQYLSFIASDNQLLQEGFSSGYVFDEQSSIFQKAKELINNALEAYKTTNDAFLKQRYAFQLVKLYHILEQFSDGMLFYESFVKANPNMPQNLTYFRTLGYYAGSKRKAGNLVEAKYLFAKIFNSCEPLSMIAYKNFKYIDLSESDMARCLKMAKTDDELAAIIVGHKIYDNQIDVELLRELYAKDKDKSRFELALLKQMNFFFNAVYQNELEKPIEIPLDKLVNEFDLYGNVISNIDKKKEGNWFVKIWNSIVDFFRRLFGKKKSADGLDDQYPVFEFKPFVLNEPWGTQLNGNQIHYSL
ncbi:MAG: hypothetical protein SNJ77_11550 [Cytophagales bacterium]